MKYNRDFEYIVDEGSGQFEEDLEQSYKPRTRHTDIDERDNKRRAKRKQKKSYDMLKHELSKQKIGP